MIDWKTFKLPPINLWNIPHQDRLVESWQVGLYTLDKDKQS